MCDKNLFFDKMCDKNLFKKITPWLPRSVDPDQPASRDLFQKRRLIWIYHVYLEVYA